MYFIIIIFSLIHLLSDKNLIEAGSIRKIKSQAEQPDLFSTIGRYLSHLLKLFNPPRKIQHQQKPKTNHKKQPLLTSPKLKLPNFKDPIVITKIFNAPIFKKQNIENLQRTNWNLLN